MESLHFNQKCAYVVAGSSHLLPYLHWALSNQHLYWPWEAVTIAKWKACVSGFGNKTHIALLASAIKYNITVYVRSWGCQYKHLGWPLLLGPCPMHKLYSLPRTILSLPCLIGDWGFSEPIFWHGDAWSMFVKYWQVWHLMPKLLLCNSSSLFKTSFEIKMVSTFTIVDIFQHVFIGPCTWVCVWRPWRALNPSLEHQPTLVLIDGGITATRHIPWHFSRR